jgi:peroxiredoxin Q/BCP
MKRVFAGAIGLLLFGGGAGAAELAVGDTAPEFALAGTDGKTYRLADLKGKTVVLAWFPKAFTAG